MALRLRRGTNAERLLITPEEGELIYTTDTKRLFVGDGTTPGGNAVDSVELLDLAERSISDLGDVDIGSDSTIPTDKQVLAYDASSGDWRPADSNSTISGSYAIDIETADGFTIIDHTQGYLYGKFIGDGSDLTGITSTIEVPEGVDLRINIIGDDSTPVLDYKTREINGKLTGDLFGDVYDNDLNVKILDASTRTVIGDVLTDFSNTILEHNTGNLRDASGDLVVDAVGKIFNGSVQGNDISAITLSGTLTGDVRGADTNLVMVDSTLEQINAPLYASVYDPSGNIILDYSSRVLTADVDGSMRGSVYNSTLTNVLVDHINEEFNGKLNGIVDGDLTGSVYSDDSTLLVDGISGTVTGTVTGKIETSESIVTDKFSDSGAGFGQDIVLKIYGGTEANKDEPNNFARAGIFMEAYDPLSSDYVKDSLLLSYHQTGGGSLLALSPTSAAGTFFETALELDGVAGTSTTRATNNIVLTSKNVSLVTSNIPASSVGQAGDTIGMVAVDATSIYYCIADYTDGLSDIWVKQDWGTTGSW